MQAAVDAALPDFRRWMRAKARLHGRPRRAAVVGPRSPRCPSRRARSRGPTGLDIVRGAFASYSQPLGGLVDRAVDEQWIDAGPRDGKRGGAFCMPFVDDRSLVFLNWSGSVDSAQTTAHELGHAYHNTQLAHRTALQRRLPMALAETASIFCETLVVEEGLHASHRPSIGWPCSTSTCSAPCRSSSTSAAGFLFETEVFARRQRRTLGVSELNEMMLSAQAEAYGDGLDQSTAHPYMWAVKPHYYGVALLQLAVHVRAAVRARPVRQVPRGPGALPASYDDVLSRAGMNTAEELGAVFGFDVSDEAFWTASLDVLRGHIDQYTALGRRRVTDVALPTEPRRARRAARRRTALPARPGLAGPVPEPVDTGGDDQPPEGVAGDVDRAAVAGAASRRAPVSDGGDTVKYLWELHDGRRIETVLMLYPDRVTVCVSSQAGCAMGCGFCATGQAGFAPPPHRRRDRRAGRRRGARGTGDGPPARQRRVHGHGRAAGQRDRGVGVGRAHARRPRPVGAPAHDLDRRARAGHPPADRAPAAGQPRRLAARRQRQLRDELVPINKRYPIDELMAACADYLAAKGRRLSFEWAMIDGVNDRAERRRRARRAVPAVSPAGPRQPDPAQPDARAIRRSARR